MVEQMHDAGDNYNVVSPVIRGYFASRVRVAGVMPNRNVDELVIYVPGETIVDYDVPLGIGNIFLNIGECIE